MVDSQYAFNSPESLTTTIYELTPELTISARGVRIGLRFAQNLR